MATIAEELIGKPSHSNDPANHRIKHAVDFTDECQGGSHGQRRLIKYISQIATQNLLIEVTMCWAHDIEHGTTIGWWINPSAGHAISRPSDLATEFDKRAQRLGITPERLEALILEHMPKS